MAVRDFLLVRGDVSGGVWASWASICRRSSVESCSASTRPSTSRSAEPRKKRATKSVSRVPVASSRKHGAVAVRLVLEVVSRQSGPLHILQEPEDRGVGERVIAIEPIEQLANGERAVFPEQREHFELSLGNRELLASRHRNGPPELILEIRYALLRMRRGGVKWPDENGPRVDKMAATEKTRVGNTCPENSRWRKRPPRNVK